MGEKDEQGENLRRGLSRRKEVLRPGFFTVGYRDQRTPEDLQTGTPLFRNEGLVQVALHVSSFASLFRDAGLIPQEINEVEFVFRPATIADRNFFGEPVWGLSLLGSGFIEIYTTVLADQMGACHTHIPMTQSSLARTMAHEADHVIRARQGDVDKGTFSLLTARRRESVGETKATKFAQDQVSHLANKIVVREDPFLPFEDNIDPKVIGQLAGLEMWADLDHRIEVWYKDWPPLDLRDEFRAKFLRPEDISKIPPVDFEGFLRKARKMVEERWIGVAEYNYMVACLCVASAERGTLAQEKILVAKQLKPGEVNFFRKKMSFGSRAGIYLGSKQV